MEIKRVRQKGQKFQLLPKRGDEWLVSKKQAVCSELARAIRLFICEHDLISAHVLAGAAADIIRGLAKANGKTVFRDHFRDYIRDEYHDAFFKIMDRDYNFFKHSAKDATATNDLYHPVLTEILIWQACRDFSTVFNERYFEIEAYSSWFYLRHPTMHQDDVERLFGTLRSQFGDVNSNDFHEATRGFRQVLNVLDQRPAGDILLPQLPSLRLAGVVGGP